MGAAERQALREAIDRAARQRFTAYLATLRPWEKCARCRMPAEDWTPGCSHCSERHRSLYRRGTHPLGEKGYLALRKQVAEKTRYGIEANEARRRTMQQRYREGRLPGLNNAPQTA